VKSPGLTALLAFLFPGLGHVYCGRFIFGFTLVLAFALGVVPAVFAGFEMCLYSGEMTWLGLPDVVGYAALLGALIFHIWQTADACAYADLVNRRGRRIPA
jgi:hypothetical protein